MIIFKKWFYTNGVFGKLTLGDKIKLKERK